MSEECNQSCGNCSDNCSESKKSFLAEQNALSNVKRVIAVVSGKGGVGKSLVTSLLASEMQKSGYKTAILDADITGPSIPKTFGLKGQAVADESGLYPIKTNSGLKIMSINLLLKNETDPVIWRGPIIANTVKQFWTDVIWGDIDFMFVDMPPGTGDVPLTVFQSLPIDGIIVVTSPQELVSMIVEKAVNMANAMNIPVLGIVENMSYFECPDCKEKHYIFGKSHIEEIVENFGLKIYAKIPVNPEIAAKCDKGQIESVDGKWLKNIVTMLEKNDRSNEKEKCEMNIAVTYEDGQVFQHFGHTEQFKIYKTKDGKILESKVVSTNGSGHSALADFLKDYQVDTLICGGIGGGAKIALAQCGIHLYPGVTGEADTQVELFLKNQLAYDPDTKCNHHDHDHEGCSEHDHNCSHLCGE